ncbi:MAG: hypothetical protein V2A69_03385 [Pseudomonadota bacterium]
MHDSETLSREEIRAILIEIHRENQALWSKWFDRISDPAERSGLYRYREGFDAAILNLAQRFRINLRTSQSSSPEEGKKEKAQVISIEKIIGYTEGSGVGCPHCQSLLFRKGKKIWHCPVCDIDFRSLEEE